MRTKEQIDGILAALEREYPMADCTLTERDAWRLLVQVRLAAQCTDARVNLVTPALFARFPTVEAMAAADIGEVEELIRSCGFYHTKARDIVACAQVLLARRAISSGRRSASRRSTAERCRTIWTIS